MISSYANTVPRSLKKRPVYSIIIQETTSLLPVE
jgi:hypothetical protein